MLATTKRVTTVKIKGSKVLEIAMAGRGGH